MGVIKRGKTYYIDVCYKGKRVRQSVGHSKRLAEKVFAKVKTEMIENRFFDKRKVSKLQFSKLIEMYLQYSKAHKRSYGRDLTSTHALLKSIGDRPISQITSLVVEGYIKIRLSQQSQRRKGTISPASVNRELACLKHMFTKAIEWELIDYNPIAKVKNLQVKDKRLRFLSVEEIERLLSSCYNYIRPIVIVAIFSGMRKSEILQLKWSDINFQNNLIILSDTKSGRTREVPLNQTLRETLRDTPRHLKSEYVFCNQKGLLFKDIRGPFIKALERAGIEDFRFHDLRHTFASHMAMNGVDLNTLREILGHSSIQMTQRYAHLASSFKQRAMQSIDTILSQSQKERKELLPK